MLICASRSDLRRGSGGIEPCAAQPSAAHPSATRVAHAVRRSPPWRCWKPRKPRPPVTRGDVPQRGAAGPRRLARAVGRLLGRLADRQAHRADAAVPADHRAEHVAGAGPAVARPDLPAPGHPLRDRAGPARRTPAQPGRPGTRARTLGLDRRRPWFDLGTGVGARRRRSASRVWVSTSLPASSASTRPWPRRTCPTCGGRCRC